MIQFSAQPVCFEDGVMFGRVTIDGTDARAGITLVALERLIERIEADPGCNFRRMVIGDLISMLRPAIETYLERVHACRTCNDGVLIIDVADIVTH